MVRIHLCIKLPVAAIMNSINRNGKDITVYYINYQ